MHGNVWEWVTDWYAESYEAGPLTDPTGAASGSYRIGRGGSWHNDSPPLRSAQRLGGTPDHRGPDVGFRVGLIKE